LIPQLPGGYVDLDRGRTRVIATRLELEEMLRLLAPENRDRLGEPVVGGRGGTRRIELAGGKAVYLRKYLRGGFVRFFNYDRYFLRPPRPVLELVATEAARAAGCYVPVVHGIAIEEAGPFYRGWIVTGALQVVATLAEGLDGVGATKRAEFLGKAGAAVAVLHRAGVYHVDLTGENLLLDRAGEVAIVDFDRAGLGEPNSVKRSQAGMDRLWRSLVKMSLERGFDLAPDERRWLDKGHTG
jgi:3-deoxy-D-manno-octulosonic acid kinase